MCLLMKKHVFDFSERIQGTTSPSIIWVKIYKEILGYEFILGSVYLPCEGSFYHNSDVFDSLIQDVIDIKCRYNVPLCLIGDLNARTGVLADYFEQENDEVSDLIGLNFCRDNDLSTLNNSYVPTSRWNMDLQVNDNGNKLLEMCKSLDLAIVNGRLGEDGGFGNFTCYNKNGGRSTIDYFLISHELWHSLQNFKVDLFDKCLSDAHCPIVVTFKDYRSNQF